METCISVFGPGSGLSHEWAGLGFLVLVILLRLFFAALFDRVAVFGFVCFVLFLFLFLFCFVLFFFVSCLFFWILPHADLGDRDVGPVFSREHGHLGNMRE